MGPTSCAAMATGSPTGPGWCPSEHAGGALLGERGGRKVGGDSEGPGLSNHPQTLVPTSFGPLPGRSTSHDKATSARPRSFTDSLQLPGQLAGRCPWGPGVYREHPASCAVSPEMLGSSQAPPRPACSGFRELSTGDLLGSAAAAPLSPSLFQQLWIRCYPRRARASHRFTYSPRRLKSTELHPL